MNYEIYFELIWLRFAQASGDKSQVQRVAKKFDQYDIADTHKVWPIMIYSDKNDPFETNAKIKEQMK